MNSIKQITVLFSASVAYFYSNMTHKLLEAFKNQNRLADGQFYTIYMIPLKAVIDLIFVFIIIIHFTLVRFIQK